MGRVTKRDATCSTGSKLVRGVGRRVGVANAIKYLEMVVGRMSTK
jgi:hypothetical protein